MTRESDNRPVPDVPMEGVGPPPLQPTQPALGKRVHSYMKKHGVAWTEENLKPALSVLAGDALQRGLILARKRELRPSESVDGFVYLGINERDGLQQEGQRLYDSYARELHTTQSSYLGMAAIPRSVLSGLKQTLDNFAITQDVGSVEDLLYVEKTREQFIPQISEFTFAVLRTQIPDVAVENFSREDQVSIIRNMIFSLVFRKNNPLPIVSTEEILDYSKTRNVQAAFNSAFVSEMTAAIAQRITPSQTIQEEIRAYIHDLAAQVQEKCLYMQERIAAISSIGEDTYQKLALGVFTDTLLLLHPALEIPIITDTRYVTSREKDNSLWHPDLSVVIEGSKVVPTITGLVKASQYAEAKGYATHRYDAGVSAWKHLHREQENRDRRKKSLEQELQETEIEISRVQDPHARLPHIATVLVDKRYPEERRAFKYKKYWRGRMEKLITNAKGERARTLDFINTLRQEHSGELPRTVKIPGWIKEQERQRQQRSLSSLHTRSENAITDGTFKLADDFFNQYGIKPHIIDIVAFETATAGEVKSLQDSVRSEITALRQSPIVSIYNDEGIGMKEVVEYLRFLQHDYARAQYPRVSFDRKQQLNYLQSVIEERNRMKYYPARHEIPSEFYLYCLEERVRVLEDVYQAKHRLQTLSPVVEVPDRWPRSKLLQLRDGVAASTLPEDFSFEAMERYIAKLNDWWANFKVSKHRKMILWPREIQGAEGFTQWVEHALEKYKKDTLRSSKTRTWDQEDRIVLLSALQQLITTNPLFPLRDIEGSLPTDDFWGALERRLDLINAMLILRDLGDVNEETQKSMWEKRKSDVYKDFLDSRKSTVTKELSEPPDRDHIEHFINRMSQQNLVMELLPDKIEKTGI